MNHEERIKVGEVWVGIAGMYDKQINPQSLRIMLDAVDDISFEKLMRAMNDWTKTSKLSRHPYPADLIAMVNPEIDKKLVAIDLARKIDKAVAKHGYNWQEGFFHSDGNYWNDDKGNKFYSFKEAVISELGEIGWHAICARGGWLRVRESANAMEEGTFIAQMRDQIQSSMALAEAGHDVTKIEMPKREQLSYNEHEFKTADFKSLIPKRYPDDK